MTVASLHSRNGMIRGPLGAFANEPPLDFSKPAVRSAFQAAIDAVRARLPLETGPRIGGESPDSGEVFEIRSPNDTSLLVGRCAMAGVEEAQRALHVARRAFATWSLTAAGERAAFLVHLAQAIRERRLELAALEVFEAAKTWREADADVCEAIDFLEYYAREALKLAAPRRMQRELLGERNDLLYAPVGPVAVIGPWNFPMAIPVGMMAAALVAGNVVLWKPAEQTPLITAEVLRLMEDCGLPHGVVSFLPGRGEVVGQALVESPEVAMIAFTGSREVGLHILREANIVRPGQRHVKRVVAEMGGKNAMIIDSSADLDSAVPDIVQSAFGFSGQKCSACSRLIVLRDVADELFPRLRDAVESLKIAPAWDPGCQINPVIDADARKKIERYDALGAKEGKLLARVDPGDLATRGHYVAASVYTAIDPGAKLAQEEVFGPVLAVITAKSFDDALRIANDTEYALTGGVQSRTLSHLDKARALYQCGNLYLNRTITGAIVGRQPFGGFRLSGVGSKAGGPDYLRQFVVARTVSENLMRHGFAPLHEDVVATSDDE